MTTVSIVQQTEQVLEWQLLIDALANEADSTMGAETCRSLSFAQDLQTARFQQQETTEMVQILEGPHPLPPPCRFQMFARHSHEQLRKVCLKDQI